MFGSHALPPPSNFANEHRPLRLTSDGPRPQPTGSCHVTLLHSTAQNQRCQCQYFHHNRSVPGNVCDCGHQACFHVHQPTRLDRQGSRDTISIAAETALVDRIQRLEETIQNEQEIREAALQRERQLWEREVRILREALAPFYKSEQDMRRKLIELEDRVEGNYDEQVRLKDSLVALDDANMALERRVDDVERMGTKRRRTSRQHHGHENGAMNGHSGSDLRRSSSNVDERSVESLSSRPLSPNSIFPAAIEPGEPRSSGILNLVDMQRSTPYSSARPLSPVQDEPRSSGFLALDLAERLSKRTFTEHAPGPVSSPVQQLAKKDQSPPSYAQSNPDGRLLRQYPSFPPIVTNGVESHTMRLSQPDFSPRKRKLFADHIALDVLADVSVASPVIH